MSTPISAPLTPDTARMHTGERRQLEHRVYARVHVHCLIPWIPTATQIFYLTLLLVGYRILPAVNAVDCSLHCLPSGFYFLPWGLGIFRISYRHKKTSVSSKQPDASMHDVSDSPAL